jgi:hypothetical protein
MAVDNNQASAPIERRSLNKKFSPRRAAPRTRPRPINLAKDRSRSHGGGQSPSIGADRAALAQHKNSRRAGSRRGPVRALVLGIGLWRVPHSQITVAGSSEYELAIMRYFAAARTALCVRRQQAGDVAQPSMSKQNHPRPRTMETSPRTMDTSRVDGVTASRGTAAAGACVSGPRFSCYGGAGRLVRNQPARTSLNGHQATTPIQETTPRTTDVIRRTAEDGFRIKTYLESSTGKERGRTARNRSHFLRTVRTQCSENASTLAIRGDDVLELPRRSRDEPSSGGAARPRARRVARFKPRRVDGVRGASRRWRTRGVASRRCGKKSLRGTATGTPRPAREYTKVHTLDPLSRTPRRRRGRQ